MDSKELRIGNYVYFKGVEVDVFSIEKNPIDWERVNGVRCEENYVSAIKPIPLTEEWLLKFGFEFFKHHYLGYDIFKKDNLLIAMMIVNVIFIDDYDTA